MKTINRKIVNSLIVDFDGFELDTDAVGMKSVSDTNIELPYAGVLPEEASSVSSAYIYFNVQLTQSVQIMLVVNNKVGRRMKYRLEASAEEIITLLDAFFKQNQDATGLAQYWLGLWQAHYIEWRRVVRCPDYLLPILSTLPVQKREYLQKYMMDDAVDK